MCLKEDKSLFILQDQKLDVVDHFNDLVSTIEKEGNMSEDIMARVMKGRQLVGVLNKVRRDLNSSMEMVKGFTGD